MRPETARFDVYLCPLDPTIGSEMRKTRPVVVLSPDVMNVRSNTVVVAPLTSSPRTYPTRVRVKLDGSDSMVALDHLRSPDRMRLLGRVGRLSEADGLAVLKQARTLFAD